MCALYGGSVLLLMDGLSNDLSKVKVLVLGFWVGELLVNSDGGPNL